MQALNARVTDLIALRDFSVLENAVSASQSVLNKAKEEYKTANQNENAVVRALWAAHAPFSQNPADLAACDALIAVLDRIPYARSATAKSKANLNNAQKAFDLANRNLGIAQQQAKAKVNAQALADIAKNQQTRADARAALAGQNDGLVMEQAAENTDHPPLDNLSNEVDLLAQSNGNKIAVTSIDSYLSFMREKLSLSPSELLSRMIATAQAETKTNAQAETEPETANRQMKDDAESTSQGTVETVGLDQLPPKNGNNEEDFLAQSDGSGIMGEGEQECRNKTVVFICRSHNPLLN